MADLKISGLTADASPTSDDLIPTVNDPGGTPANRKVTLANAITKAHGLSDGAVVSVVSSALVSNAVTSSAAELNILDGATLTVTELNYVDGVTSAIQTQLDGKQASDADLTTLATAFSSASASGAASLAFHEDTDNGTNKITVVGVASVASDKTLTLPDATDTLVGKATTDTLTNKTIDADGTGNSITNIENADIKAAAAIDATKIADGTVTSAEFQYLGGVTSDIQTQLNAKQGTLTNSAGLAAALSDETGTGLAVFNNSPTFVDDITVGGAGVATGQIKISGTTSGTATITVPAVAGTPTYVLPAAVGASGTFLKDAAGDGVLSWAAPAGAGTVTNTGGDLTANAVVLGAGTTDTKVVAGIITDGTSVLTLGVNATTIGKVKMFGNTSGDATIQPSAAAGTATVLTLPAASDTLVGKATTDTLTNKTFDADGTGNSITNIENADIKAAAAIAVNKLAALTVSELVVTDGSGFLTTSSGVSATEAGFE